MDAKVYITAENVISDHNVNIYFHTLYHSLSEEYDMGKADILGKYHIYIYMLESCRIVS